MNFLSVYGLKKIMGHRTPIHFRKGILTADEVIVNPNPFLSRHYQAILLPIRKRRMILEALIAKPLTRQELGVLLGYYHLNNCLKQLHEAGFICYGKAGIRRTNKY